MRIRLALRGAVAALALMGAGAALAADHTTIGTPGSPNCRGQTMAWLNATGKANGVHGIGNIARFSGLTPQELKAEIAAYCGGLL